MLKTYSGRNPAGLLAVCLLALSLCQGCSLSPGINRDHDADISPAELIIGFYRGPLDHLNAVRTGQCPMYPSCSHYARQAAEKHGPVPGWLLASDRLIRCGRDELDYARKVPVNGKWRYYDPLSANDLWLSGGSSHSPEGQNR